MRKKDTTLRAKKYGKIKIKRDTARMRNRDEKKDIHFCKIIRKFVFDNPVITTINLNSCALPKLKQID